MTSAGGSKSGGRTAPAVSTGPPARILNAAATTA